MKQSATKRRTSRPKLPKAPEEMRQWSACVLQEVLAWEGVRSRPMFGMTAVYRGAEIFGALPRTRAMDSPYAVSFKLRRDSTTAARLDADPRIIVPEAAPMAGWVSFELRSGDDIPDAIRWFHLAWRHAGPKKGRRRSAAAPLGPRGRPGTDEGKVPTKLSD